METRFGVRGNVYEGVFFTENAVPGATTIRHLHVEISRQNADLGEVKRRLAQEARTIDMGRRSTGGGNWSSP